jgi:esterase/lipase superfamily enzyme
MIWKPSWRQLAANPPTTCQIEAAMTPSDVPARSFAGRALRASGMAMLLAFGLSGCIAGEASEGNLKPGPLKSTSEMASDPVLLVATMRKPGPSATASPFFTSDRGTGLVFAEARLALPRSGITAQVTSLGQTGWSVTELRNRVTAGAAQAFAQAANGRDVLLYVHGYNETFETAAASAATLSDAIGFQGRTALFAWPSGGRLLNYVGDRESATWSRDGFEAALRALGNNPSIGRVHIVAHSMGTLLTLESLRQIPQSDPLRQKLGAIVFASPDIDIDIFEANVTKLGPLASRMTMIIDPGDRALAVSARLAGGVTRAGAADRARLEALGMRVADAGGIGWSVLRHDLFLSNSEVTQVIRRAMDRAG